MGFPRAVLSAFINFMNFSGRATRSEFWYFQLFIFVTPMAIATYLAMTMSPERLLSMASVTEGSIAALAVSIFLFVQSWSLIVRRLHDSDRSGFWVLISFVPLLGALVLLVFAVQPSTPGANRFGPDRMGNTKRVAAPKRAQRMPQTDEDRRAEVSALYQARVVNRPA